MTKSLIKFIIAISILIILSNNVFAKNKETYELLDLFGQIFDQVRDKYVEEVTDKDLIEKAIDGMLTGLDPHSGYMDEEVWKEMQMDTKAAIAFKAGEPLQIETVQLEGPREDEVLVEIKATGVCHTDEFTRSGDDPEGLFPSILGHEGAGVVIDDANCYANEVT